MSYGVSFTDLDRRAATYVDKILERRQARRSSRRAAEEVRVHHQSESSKADRPDDSAECAGAGGQSHTVRREGKAKDSEIFDCRWFDIAHHRIWIRETYMKRLRWIRFFGSRSDNLKSKACPGPRSGIENLKLAGLSRLLSNSRWVGLWPRRSSRRKFHGLVTWA